MRIYLVVDMGVGEHDNPVIGDAYLSAAEAQLACKDYEDSDEFISWPFVIGVDVNDSQN